MQRAVSTVGEFHVPLGWEILSHLDDTILQPYRESHVLPMSAFFILSLKHKSHFLHPLLAVSGVCAVVQTGAS